ncbi:hypothetical protein [Chitinophaga costaii]|nr:hypothetical protein [Chitinophaga costaii]
MCKVSIKYLMIMAALLLCATACHTRSNKRLNEMALQDSWYALHLQWKVKTLTQYEYIARNGEKPGAWYRKDVYNFDQDGYLQENQIYFNQGAYQDLKQPALYLRQEYTYDNRQNLVLKKVYASDGHLNYRERFVYDDHNSLARQTGVNGGGIDTFRIAYQNKYNRGGQIVERRTSAGKPPKPVAKEIYTYNANGNLETEKKYGSDPVKKNFYLLYSITSKYNGDWLLISQEKRDALAHTLSTLTYDLKGNVLKNLVKDDDGNIDNNATDVMTYEFDKRGNWTIQTVADAAGKAKTFYKREIVYY